ncbi:unnamed protein product [Acanthoscelides obtectus]|uniref:SCAN domain-containing protein 3 n=1 Tax=Acanthoscelides obtectus TaxID=200917 RepID=A0A9P0P868_ACAOB|nr:unnamed protein product [Acanthoscelides obtectus]CAK1632468.1 SCAN domain-containing protein 3 [Acanthoscelides obtectus]
MKPSKLQDHLRRCHPDRTEKDLKYFQTLTDKFQKRPTLDRMFASTSQRNDDGLRASYNISLLIAKSGKPHTIGDKLILPAVEEVLKTVLHKPASDIIKRISLSNNTVERRIDEMSSDIENFLCNYLQTTHFSIQLDESSLPDNAALLLPYVRFIMNQEIYEELLFARTLITDTKVTETWLNDNIGSSAIRIPNYNFIRTDRIGRGGGVGFALKELIKSNFLRTNISPLLEEQWISFRFEGKTCYRFLSLQKALSFKELREMMYGYESHENKRVIKKELKQSLAWSLTEGMVRKVALFRLKNLLLTVPVVFWVHYREPFAPMTDLPISIVEGSKSSSGERRRSRDGGFILRHAAPVCRPPSLFHWESSRIVDLQVDTEV